MLSRFEADLGSTRQGILSGVLLVTAASVFTMHITPALPKWPSLKQRRIGRSATPPRNGHDFETWVAARLARHGWSTYVTRGSGDQGIDIIARRRGRTVGIQCKRYRGAVGNKAVQEAFAGRAHYRLDKAAVVTTGRYTKSAKELSRSTGVALLTVSDLPRMHRLI